jgi:transposase
MARNARHINKMAEAARLWATGKALNEVAIELKVARSTAYRWKLDPDFARMVADYRYEAMAGCFNLCVNLQKQAIETLGKLLTSGRADIRLKAAVAITELNHKLFIEHQADSEILRLEEQILKFSPQGRVPANHNELLSAAIVDDDG